jgi:uncharacterized protein (DUF302 family)
MISKIMFRLIFISVFLNLINCAGPLMAQEGMAVVESSYSVEETADRVQNSINEMGLTLFQRIEHHENAAGVNLELPPTTLFIFGNPALGTQLMMCGRTVAADLPMKMLVWQTETGEIHIGFNEPAYLQQRHNLEGCEEALNKASNALSDIAIGAAGK